MSKYTITEHRNKDMLGHKIDPEDFIAYPVGRGPSLGLYKVVAVTPKKENYDTRWKLEKGIQPYEIRARQISANGHPSWNTRDSILQFPECAIVLNESTMGYVYREAEKVRTERGNS